MIESISFDPERIKPIIKRINIDNLIIIDVGCGLGDYTYLFKTLGAVSIGLDINIQYIKKAKNKQINFIIASATEPPFKETTIDIYFINEVLEHINKDIKVISEAYKIIKRNGLICVYAPNKIYPWETHLRIKKMPSFLYRGCQTLLEKKYLNYSKKNTFPYIQDEN